MSFSRSRCSPCPAAGFTVRVPLRIASASASSRPAKVRGRAHRESGERACEPHSCERWGVTSEREERAGARHSCERSGVTVSPVSLVTGGAGFIGSHLADALLYAGHRVVVLDDLSGGRVDNVPADADLVLGSVCEYELVDRLFDRHRFDYVFHFGAYAAEGLSHFIKRHNYLNNVIGSVNVINASVNSGTVRCLVFASTIAVYGRARLPMTEDMTPQPIDPYGIAKFTV